MTGTILFYLLEMKMQFFRIMRYIRSTIFGVSEVSYLDQNENIQYITFRFILVQLLRHIQTRMQRVIQWMIDALDMNIYKAQIIKNYSNGQRRIIVCPKLVNKDELTITDL